MAKEYTKEWFWEEFDSKELCEEYSDYFEEWWDPDKFDWEYSYYLPKHVSEYFKIWWNTDTIKLYQYDSYEVLFIDDYEIDVPLDTVYYLIDNCMNFFEIWWEYVHDKIHTTAILYALNIISHKYVPLFLKELKLSNRDFHDYIGISIFILLLTDEFKKYFDIWWDEKYSPALFVHENQYVFKWLIRNIDAYKWITFDNTYENRDLYDLNDLDLTEYIDDFLKYQRKNSDTWISFVDLSDLFYVAQEDNIPLKSWWNYLTDYTKQDICQDDRYIEILCDNYEDEFDTWFDNTIINVYDASEYLVYCSDQFDKWWDSKHFNWDYVHLLVQYCSEHFEKWWDPKMCWILLKNDTHLLYYHNMKYKKIWNPKV